MKKMWMFPFLMAMILIVAAACGKSDPVDTPGNEPKEEEPRKKLLLKIQKQKSLERKSQKKKNLPYFPWKALATPCPTSKMMVWQSLRRRIFITWTA